eukprot:GHVT01014346.1.p1 GENE.GHVT01014346.1~~GHVT01014346.1.p1  ORF type:complete len:193 (+),score=49.60 GHVT01014346.1:706-1284(+)
MSRRAVEAAPPAKPHGAASAPKSSRMRRLWRLLSCGSSSATPPHAPPHEGPPLAAAAAAAGELDAGARPPPPSPPGSIPPPLSPATFASFPSPAVDAFSPSTPWEKTAPPDFLGVHAPNGVAQADADFECSKRTTPFGKRKNGGKQTQCRGCCYSVENKPEKGSIKIENINYNFQPRQKQRVHGNKRLMFNR